MISLKSAFPIVWECSWVFQEKKVLNTNKFGKLCVKHMFNRFLNYRTSQSL